MKKVRFIESRRLLLLALWLPLLLTLILVELAYQGQHSRDRAALSVLHTAEVKDQMEHLNTLIRDVEANQRDYLLTGNGAYHELYQKALEEIPATTDRLGILISDNPHQVAALADFKKVLGDKLAVEAQMASFTEQGNLAGAILMMKGGQAEQLMNKIQTSLQGMEAEEDRLLISRKATYASQVRIQNGFIEALVALDITLIIGVSLLMQHLNRLRMKTEQELERARDAAEMSDRAKTQFLANMSHEIRTPLNGIIGTTELMFSTPMDHEQRDYLETIHTSGDNLLAIINDVLDYSKIEFDRLELDFHPFNLLDLINEVVSMLSYRAIAKNLNIVYLVDPHLPVHYEGDATRLRQVLANLVSNGIKFTEKGEITLVVNEGSRLPQDAVGVKRLLFKVMDTGIGIPLDRQDRLFKVFSQVDASTTRKYGGSGLGLVICQKLVGLMGGTIRVESAPGQGSTFQFDLPLRRGEYEGSLLLDNSGLAGKNVLIVDDIENNRRMLTQLLTRWGVATVEASSAQQALLILRNLEKPFDLALIDFQMSQMDGLMLAREIKRRETTRALPLVLISSQNGGVPEVELREAGFVGSLVKPVRQNHLRSTLLELFTKGTLSPAHPAAVQAPGKTLKILIADDNELNHRVTLYMLKRLGYEADQVINGLEAITALEKKDYDVIFMDIHMPEMDGLEATRQIRQQFPHRVNLKIIALTANALKGERERCLEAGMDDYISKPMKMEALKEALREAA